MFFQLCLTTFSFFLAFFFCLTLLLSPWCKFIPFHSRIPFTRDDDERAKKNETRGKVLLLGTKLLIVMIFLASTRELCVFLSHSVAHSMSWHNPRPIRSNKKNCMREKTMKISPRISRWKTRFDTFSWRKMFIVSGLKTSCWD